MPKLEAKGYENKNDDYNSISVTRVAPPAVLCLGMTVPTNCNAGKQNVQQLGSLKHDTIRTVDRPPDTVVNSTLSSDIWSLDLGPKRVDSPGRRAAIGAYNSFWFKRSD